MLYTMPDLWCLKRTKFPKNPTNLSRTHSIITYHKCNLERRRTFTTIKPTIWEDIVMEDKEFANFEKKKRQKCFPKFDCPSNYLKEKLFPYLIPAFEKLCFIVLKKNILHQPVRFFDFLDELAEALYNKNSTRWESNAQWISIHLIHSVRNRPYYPYFWFLTPDEAAVKIQSLVRGFMIRRKYDLAAIKIERKKTAENIGKQKICYNTLKEQIEKAYK